jgi:hypothetical protein
VTDQPAPQNSCGTCIACCYALAFNAEEGYRKKAGDMCQHCTGTGCGAYETRYKLCHLFNCAWRRLPLLGEEWRPSNSGVMLLEVEGDEIPEAYRASGVGMEFLILTDESAILRPGFAEYIATLVSRRVVVCMSLIGRPKTVINEYLEGLVAAKDMAGLRKMLLHIFHLHQEAKRLGIAAERGPDG